jgi:hypothetical protein
LRNAATQRTKEERKENAVPTPCRSNFTQSPSSGLKYGNARVQLVTNFLKIRAGRGEPCPYNDRRGHLKVAATRLELGERFRGGEDFLGVGEEGIFECGGVGDGRVQGSDAEDRAVEIVEGFFEEDGGDFA